MAHTLRSFLEHVDNRLLKITDPIDPISQIGYLCSESRGPLMFENLVGFEDWRLTDILIKDRAGQAAALGLDDVKEVCRVRQITIVQEEAHVRTMQILVDVLEPARVE